MDTVTAMSVELSSSAAVSMCAAVAVCLCCLADPPRSNNSLTALPDDLFPALSKSSIRLVDLSRNKFTAAGVSNFRSALAGISNGLYLDLSFNDIGPSVPASVAQWPASASTLLLIGCGITDVPTNAFAGSNWELVDLSLNDLRSGLHPNTFSGSSRLTRIGMSNCNLRSSSLASGVFDADPASLPSSWSLFMDNLDANLSGVDGGVRFPHRGMSPKLPLDPRLLSFSALNSPGQPLTNQVTVACYLESWANFFSPFPAGVFYSSAAEAVHRQPKWTALTLGGECQCYTRPWEEWARRLISLCPVPL